MEFIKNEINIVIQKIEKLQNDLSSAEKETDLYNKMNEKLTILKERKNFLKKFKLILETRVKTINTNIDARIKKTKPENKKEIEQLERQRKEQLANNTQEKEIENIVSKLPNLSEFSVGELQSPTIKEQEIQHIPSSSIQAYCDRALQDPKLPPHIVELLSQVKDKLPDETIFS